MFTVKITVQKSRIYNNRDVAKKAPAKWSESVLLLQIRIRIQKTEREEQE